MQFSLPPGFGSQSWTLNVPLTAVCVTLPLRSPIGGRSCGSTPASNLVANRPFLSLCLKWATVLSSFSAMKRYRQTARVAADLRLQGVADKPPGLELPIPVVVLEDHGEVDLSGKGAGHGEILELALLLLSLGGR